MSGTLFSAWWFYKPNYKYDAFVAALYGALYRTTWATGMSWTIIAVSTGNGGKDMIFIVTLSLGHWFFTVTEMYRNVQRPVLGNIILEKYYFKNLKFPSLPICFWRIEASKSGGKKFANQKSIKIRKLQNVNYNYELTQFIRFWKINF